MDKITNGSRIELNETGTSLYYSPGLLAGGEIDHECSLQRGIGYYLEGVMALAPFCKTPISIKLKGVTNNTQGINHFTFLCTSLRSREISKLQLYFLIHRS